MTYTNTNIPINSQDLFYEALQTIPVFPHPDYTSNVSFLAEGIKPPFCEDDIERYQVECSENGVLPYSRLWLNDREASWHEAKKVFTIALSDNDWPDADLFFDDDLIGANINYSEIPQSIKKCSDLGSLIGSSSRIHCLDVIFRPALEAFQKSLLERLRGHGYQVYDAHLHFTYSPFYNFSGILDLRQEDLTFNRGRKPLLEKGLDLGFDRSRASRIDGKYVKRLDKWFEALRKKHESK